MTIIIYAVNTSNEDLFLKAKRGSLCFRSTTLKVTSCLVNNANKSACLLQAMLQNEMISIEEIVEKQ